MKTKNIFHNISTRLWQSEIENLEYLVSKYNIEYVIELGTGRGGSSLVFVESGVKDVITFDTKDIKDSNIRYIYYRIADIFKCEDEIKNYCNDERRKLLFCDNGDKKREINTFGKYLNKGDILCAHDYPIEFNDIDIHETINKYNFKKIDLPNKDRIIAWIKDI